jgi:hypothetical protein
VALSGESADEVFGGYPWFHDPKAVDAATFPWLVTTGTTFAGTQVLDPDLLGLRESCSRRGRRDFGGPIPSRNILAQQEGDQGYACATGPERAGLERARSISAWVKDYGVLLDL